MTSTPVSNYQNSLVLTQAFNLTGVFPTQDGGAGGAFLDEIFTYAFNFAPGGMLQAQGQVLQINTNQAVFALTGTTYGGDGLRTFDIPNLTGATAIGTGNGPGLPSSVLGVLEGSAGTTLTDGELPPDLGGTSQPFSNYEPSLPLTYMIRVTGIFPTMDGGGGSQDYMGGIAEFAGNFVPRDYMPCDGRLLPINQYQALFALLGTTYGGDGRVTFALPDLRGRTIVGASNDIPLGTKFGTPTVSLSDSQAPNGGATNPFDNREPSLALNYYISPSGIFPSQGGGGGANADTPFVGEIQAFAGNFAPGDGILCDGRLLAISQYDVLFNLIGTTYGGDGVNTFGVPDLRGRTVLGAGSSFHVGDLVGADATTVTLANLPLVVTPGTAPAAEIFRQGVTLKPALIDPGVTVADSNSTSLASATVSIGSGFVVAADVLTVDVTGTLITPVYNFGSGVLTLSGTDTLANYQKVLASVAFSTTTPLAPSTRTITTTVNDGTILSPPVSITLHVAPIKTIGPGITVNFIDGTSATITTASGIVDGLGNDFGDTLDASGDANQVLLEGGLGNDSLTTGAGGGRLIGQGGNNTLIGGAAVGATDIFVGGGGGSNAMTGGNGTNVFRITNSDSVQGNGTYNYVLPMVDGVTLSLGTNDIQEVDLHGGSNSVDMTGATFATYLYGAAGNDTLTTGSGGGNLYGGGGTNALHGGARRGRRTSSSAALAAATP